MRTFAAKCELWAPHFSNERIDRSRVMAIGLYIGERRYTALDMPENRAGGYCTFSSRLSRIEAADFHYTVVSSPYLVSTDLVVSWCGGVCRISSLRSLPLQCFIFPFKSHSPLSFGFISTIFLPNNSPHKETHQCDRDNNRKGNDSALQVSLV